MFCGELLAPSILGKILGLVLGYQKFMKWVICKQRDVGHFLPVINWHRQSQTLRGTISQILLTWYIHAAGRITSPTAAFVTARAISGIAVAMESFHRCATTAVLSQQGCPR